MCIQWEYSIHIFHSSAIATSEPYLHTHNSYSQHMTCVQLIQQFSRNRVTQKKKNQMSWIHTNSPGLTHTTQPNYIENKQTHSNHTGADCSLVFAKIQGNTREWKMKIKKQKKKKREKTNARVCFLQNGSNDRRERNIVLCSVYSVLLCVCMHIGIEVQDE